VSQLASSIGTGDEEIGQNEAIGQSARIALATAAVLPSNAEDIPLPPPALAATTEDIPLPPPALAATRLDTDSLPEENSPSEELPINTFLPPLSTLTSYELKEQPGASTSQNRDAEEFLLENNASLSLPGGTPKAIQGLTAVQNDASESSSHPAEDAYDFVNAFDEAFSEWPNLKPIS